MKKIVKKVKKNTTLDDIGSMIESLAVSTSRGFDRVDKRFEEVSKRFEDIDGRFDQVDARFDKIETTIHNIDTKLESVDNRLKKVEDALEPLMVGYHVFGKELRSLNLRLDRLEKKVGLK